MKNGYFFFFSDQRGHFFSNNRRRSLGLYSCMVYSFICLDHSKINWMCLFTGQPSANWNIKCMKLKVITPKGAHEFFMNVCRSRLTVLFAS